MTRTTRIAAVIATAAACAVPAVSHAATGGVAMGNGRYTQAITAVTTPVTTHAVRGAAKVVRAERAVTTGIQSGIILKIVAAPKG